MFFDLLTIWVVQQNLCYFFRVSMAVKKNIKFYFGLFFQITMSMNFRKRSKVE